MSQTGRPQSDIAEMRRILTELLVKVDDGMTSGGGLAAIDLCREVQQKAEVLTATLKMIMAYLPSVK